MYVHAWVCVRVCVSMRVHVFSFESIVYVLYITVATMTFTCTKIIGLESTLNMYRIDVETVNTKIWILLNCI